MNKLICNRSKAGKCSDRDCLHRFAHEPNWWCDPQRNHLCSTSSRSGESVKCHCEEDRDR